MRKVEIELTVKMTLTINEGIELQQVVNELDYEFYDTTGEADIYSTDITGFDLIDSKRFKFKVTQEVNALVSGHIILEADSYEAAIKKIESLSNRELENIMELSNEPPKEIYYDGEINVFDNIGEIIRTF